ncbi:AraC family transcriptional regulator, partial [Pseudomonas sp. FW305-33]
FGDSAHFSRAFRHRFGMPPREFRQQEAERATSQPGVAGQRGWPQEALAQLRVHQSVEARSNVFRADIAEPRTAGRRHHHL